MTIFTLKMKRWTDLTYVMIKSFVTHSIQINETHFIKIQGLAESKCLKWLRLRLSHIGCSGSITGVLCTTLLMGCIVAAWGPLRLLSFPAENRLISWHAPLMATTLQDRKNPLRFIYTYKLVALIRFHFSSSLPWTDWHQMVANSRID